MERTRVDQRNLLAACLNGLDSIKSVHTNNNIFWAVVVAQLVERSLPINVNCIEKTKIKKRGREWSIKVTTYFTGLVKSNPVTLEISHTVNLPL